MSKRNYTYKNINESYEANSDECIICDGKKKYSNWVLCGECDNWYHPRCLGIPQTEIEALEGDFVCHKCAETNPAADEPFPMDQSNNLGEEFDIGPFDTDANEQEDSANNSEPVINPEQHVLQTSIIENTDLTTSVESNQEQPSSIETSGSDPDHQEKSQTSSNNQSTTGDCVVEKIINWRMRSGKREFQIKFVDFEELEWKKEEELVNCPVLLEHFIRKNRLSGCSKRILSTKSKKGNLSLEQANKDNWADVEQIISMVEVYGDRTSLTVKPFTKLDDQDGIFILTLGNHCYTVLYNSKFRSCLISDGQGSFLEDPLVRRTILLMLKPVTSVVYIPYNGQKAIDHCASSAAGIAIEFQRVYRTGKIPREISVPSSTIERIRKVLHKSDSAKIYNWTPVSNFGNQVQCDSCGKRFKTKNRGAMNLHKC